LQEAYDEARQKVWARQPAEFFAEARLYADSTIVGALGECKGGMAKTKWFPTPTADAIDEDPATRKLRASVGCVRRFHPHPRLPKK